MTSGFHAPVLLHELLGDAELGLGQLCAPPRGAVAREVVLVGDVDEILDVPPDCVVLVPEAIALGGWTISVALRYAWERRAAALVVPDQAYPSSVLDLARRFEVGLFSTREGVTRTALDIARGLGRRTAGALAELDLLGSRIREAASLEAAVEALSAGLDDALVELVFHGAALARAGAAPTGAAPAAVSLGRAGVAEIRALVAPARREYARRALHVASPTLRALIAEEELRRDRAAAPVLSAAALGAARSLAVLSGPRARAPGLAWPLGGRCFAVCLRAESLDDVERLGPAIVVAWRSGFPQAPLGRVDIGWLSILSLERSDEARLRELIGARVGPVARSLGLAIGVSGPGDGPESANALVSQAWLAARMAAADGRVVAFDRIARRLVGRALPASDAQALSRLYFPRLVEDPHCAELAAAVVAVLDCAGNASTAARRLGVHRNTIQARLRRAAELGVALDDPENLLAVHLLLDGIGRGEHDEVAPPASAAPRWTAAIPESQPESQR